ncbi:MAG: hypothetical protein AAGD96_25905 [Chloroflexota bacterium]
MTDYVLLYNGGSMPETQEAQDAMMAKWGAWLGGLGEAVVDGGNPFSGQAKSIAVDGTVSAGSLAEGSSGYSIISASSLDAAVEAAQGCPVLENGGSISVFETIAM